MRQRLAIIITFVVVIAVLVLLNAVSYVRVERAPDSEIRPDRSTYNSGATGTRALFDYLNENGHRAIQWREAPIALESKEVERPATFVVVGETLLTFDQRDVESLLKWVGRGGRLVLIDRRPDHRLLPISGNWQVSPDQFQYPSFNANPENIAEMTQGARFARPSQPTVLTRNVENVMPSRFASVLKIEAVRPTPTKATDSSSDENAPVFARSDSSIEDEPPPVAAERPDELITNAFAPVVHLIDSRGAMLVDYPYQRGRIVVLSDPFIAANSGIAQADNLLLAVNTIVGPGGLVAFDEYHQGRSNSQNELAAYFAGTPVLPMVAQFGIVVLAIVISRSRRFGRPLPLPRVDRRSNLEFVASMSELQQRARAFDLAIENIYTRTRRVLARYAGVDGGAERETIAKRVGERSPISAKQLTSLMKDCEEAMLGEQIDAQKTLKLVRRLREVEKRLGLRMRSRDIRQFREKQDR